MEEIRSLNIYQPYDQTGEIHFYQYFQTDNDHFSFDFDGKMKDFRYLVVCRMYEKFVIHSVRLNQRKMKIKNEINVYDNIFDNRQT